MKTPIFIIFLACLVQCIQAGEYRYSFTRHPRSDSSGTLTDGSLEFVNSPDVEPSPIDSDGDGTLSDEWGVRLERASRQYARTEDCGQSTVFNGSYRAELFFRPDGLSDLSGTIFDTRQGLIYIGDPSVRMMLFTQRDIQTGAVVLGVMLRMSDNSLETWFGESEINLNRWYHAEVVALDQGNDGQSTDRVSVLLNGAEEIQIENISLFYLDQVGRMLVGNASSESRTFQGNIDEVVVSSETGDDSLLQQLAEASSVLDQQAALDIYAIDSHPVLRYTASVGGEHRVFHTDSLLATNWIDAGLLEMDDQEWSGEWTDPVTNETSRFYRVQTDRYFKSIYPTVADVLEDGSGDFDPWNTNRWSFWYDGDQLIRPFDINTDVTFDSAQHDWSPDLSSFPENSGLFEITSETPVSIEGNGLVVDIRTPEFASMSIADLYTLDGSDVYTVIANSAYGVYFNQQNGSTVTSTVSGITFRGFDKALQCNHFNRMAGVVTNCVFEYNRWALFPRGTPIFRVESCTVRRNLRGGVYAEYGSSNWSFVRNVFQDNNTIGAWSWGDIVLDACYSHRIEENDFLGTTQVPHNYDTAVSLYRNRGEAGDIREFASMNHQIRNNRITGYHIGIDVAVRTGRDNSEDGNDKSRETRTYAYNNILANNTFSNCVIGIHLVGNRNVIASNSYKSVEKEVALHSPFYKNEGTLFDGEAGTDVWLWGDAEQDYADYKTYVPHQNRAERHVAQSDRLFFVSSINGTPAFQNTDGKNFVNEQTLLIGNRMQEVVTNGGVIRDIAAADFSPNYPGTEFAVIWDQPVSRISTVDDGYATYTDYYSIIIYDQSGKEIDRCGRSTLPWSAVAGGNFIEGAGFIHSDSEAEIAAVRPTAEGETYPLYIFRKGWAAPALVMQTNADTEAIDLSVKRGLAEEEYASLAVLRGADIFQLSPSTGIETESGRLAGEPVSIALGEFNRDFTDGNELAVLYSNSVSVCRLDSLIPVAAVSYGAWSAMTAGEFDGNPANGDELALASEVAEDGLYPVFYFNGALTNAFKVQSHSILAHNIRALSSGPVTAGVGPNGYLRYGDGRASFAFDFQPRFEQSNTGLSSEGDLLGAGMSFAPSPFDFDGDGAVDDEQAASFSHDLNQYAAVSGSTNFVASDGSYTIEAFFNAASLPGAEAVSADTRRGIFYWHSTHINGSLHLYRDGDSLRLQALVREGYETFSPARVSAADNLEIGRWYHAALKVFDQGNDGQVNDRIELYLNGELAGRADDVNLEYFTGGNVMNVAHSQDSGTRSFDGLLDGVRILAGTDAASLLDDIPNARAVLGLPDAGTESGDHILVLPDRNVPTPVYWMNTDGVSQELRVVPVLR